MPNFRKISPCLYISWKYGLIVFREIFMKILYVFNRSCVAHFSALQLPPVYQINKESSAAFVLLTGQELKAAKEVCELKDTLFHAPS